MLATQLAIILLIGAAAGQTTQTQSYTLSVTRVSSNPVKLSLNAAAAPAAEVLRAVGKEAGLAVLASDDLTVPITAQLPAQTPDSLISMLAQFKGISLRPIRLPANYDLKDVTAAKLAALANAMDDLKLAAAFADAPAPGTPAGTKPKPLPAVTIVPRPEADSTPTPPPSAQEMKTVWVAVPEKAAEPAPKQGTVTELARLNQQAVELMMKMTPEERKAWSQAQVDLFRQLPLPLQQQMISDGMGMMLSLTPKEQGNLLIGMFRQMTPEQRKAFLGLGAVFMQEVQPGELETGG